MSISQYLHRNGVAANRMKPLGYGHTRLIIGDEIIRQLQSKEQQEQAHAMNRRTVIRIVDIGN